MPTKIPPPSKETGELIDPKLNRDFDAIVEAIAHEDLAAEKTP